MINPLWRSSDRPAGIGFRGLAAAFGVFFLFCLLPAQLAEAAVWYVNDTSTTGDSYTFAAGADTHTGTAAAPHRHIKQAMDSAAAGDTIYIDAGLYDSHAIVNSTETAGVNIDKDSITLIGKDSNATVINPPGDSIVTNVYGIYADTQTGLTIKNIGVMGAYNGIHFDNVDKSRLESDSASANGQNGIYLLAKSESNTLTGNVSSYNASYGFYLNTSCSANTLTDNIAKNNSYGFYLNTNSNGNTLSNDSASYNAYGFFVTNVSNNTITGNTSTNNTTNGFHLNAGGYNTFTSNTSSNNNTQGFNVFGSSNQTFTNNTSSNNGSSGFNLQSSSNNNTLTGNICRNNPNGIQLLTTISGNKFTGNLVTKGTYGFVLSGASDNMFIGNTADSNTSYAFDIQGASSSDTFDKNVMVDQPLGVRNTSSVSANIFTFTRNWWGTADSAGIRGKILAAAADSIIYIPWRLGIVDPAPGADTTAPKAPDTVGIIGAPSDTSIILEWSAVTALEESNGGAVGLSGYRVYRSEVKDTSSWIKVAQQTGIRYQDTDARVGARYYYRVTAFDAAAFPNESFFSDSQPSDSAVFTTTKNWYVNDGWVNGTTDSFTSAGGSDTSYGLGTASRPFRTIPRAMQFVTAGDTIWIDAGLYDSHTTANTAADTTGVKITLDTLTLIGKDSNATVINPPGDSSLTTLYGILLTGQAITIKNLGVTGAYYGIISYGSLRSSVAGCSSTYNGAHGLVASWGSETLTITGSIFNSNSLSGIHINAPACTVNTTTANSNAGVGAAGGIYLAGYGGHSVTDNVVNSNVIGIYIDGSTRNTVSGNTVNSSTNTGIYLTGTPNADTNTISNNTIQSSASYGFLLASGNGNIFTGNTEASSTKGIGINTSSNNIFTGNTFKSNTQYGIEVDNSSRSTFSRNVISSNTLYGLYMIGPSKDNTFVQNTFDSNVKYQVYMAPNAGIPAADTFLKNNFQTSPTNPDSGVYESAGNTFDFTRNYWGRTDSVSIGRMMADTVGITNRIKFQPYRLALVDTTAGADTTAPKAPDTVGIIGAPSDTSVILEWSAVTALEESNGGAVGLSGYRVYRSAVKDTSSWVKVAQVGSGVIRYQDTDVLPGQGFYYRITAFDATVFPNESFFSDS